MKPSSALSETPHARIFISPHLITLICASILTICSVYLIKQEWQINHAYLQTQCIILDEHQSHPVEINNGSTQHLYSPKLYVSFNIGNQVIKEWTGISPLRLSNPYLLDLWSTHQFIKGNTYPCWYNPANPRTVALERGYSLFSIAFLLVSVYLLFSFLYLTIRKAESL